jgi:predicted transcriptional regulator
MAKRKEGHEVLFVEMPEELKERLRAVSKWNKRSMVGEAVVAIERHVKAEEAARAAETAGDKAKGKKGGKS